MKAMSLLFALSLPAVVLAHEGHPEAALGPHHLHGLTELGLGLAAIALGWVVKRQAAKAKAKSQARK